MSPTPAWVLLKQSRLGPEVETLPLEVALLALVHTALLLVVMAAPNANENESYPNTTARALQLITS